MEKFLDVYDDIRKLMYSLPQIGQIEYCLPTKTLHHVYTTSVGTHPDYRGPNEDQWLFLW